MFNHDLILGILGGGQLEKMSAMSAAELGIKVIIYTDEQDAPASQVAYKTINGALDDLEALELFAQHVDIITYEFENMPLESIKHLQKFKPVLPDERLLEISQHRIREKTFLNDLGIKTTNWHPISRVEDVEKLFKETNLNAFIIKTNRFGYDGKGQVKVKIDQDFKKEFGSLKTTDLIAEEIVDFMAEISVVVARDKAGKLVNYPPVVNEHKNHILHKTIAPAEMPPEILGKAIEDAYKVANEIDLIGVLSVEYFVTAEGEVLANEIAPRPHNSGHWTIDACDFSQFDQHVRAVCALDVIPPYQHSKAEMINLIGDDVKECDKYLRQEKTHLHLYGKKEIRPGRKMGHVTILK